MGARSHRPTSKQGEDTNKWSRSIHDYVQLNHSYNSGLSIGIYDSQLTSVVTGSIIDQ